MRTATDQLQCIEGNAKVGLFLEQDFFELGVILLRKKLYTQATKNLEKASRIWDGEPEELAQVGVYAGALRRSCHDCSIMVSMVLVDMSVVLKLCVDQCVHVDQSSRPLAYWCSEGTVWFIATAGDISERCNKLEGRTGGGLVQLTGTARYCVRTPLGGLEVPERQKRKQRALWPSAFDESAAVVQVHNALGFAYFNMQRTELAVKNYRKAVELQPGYVTAWNNLGDAHEKAKDWEEVRVLILKL